MNRIMQEISRRSAPVIVLVAATALSGCVVSRSPITGNKRAYGYTWQEEVELGRGAVVVFGRQSGVLVGARALT